MDNPQPRRAYTVAEAAAALGVSTWLVREQCRTGQLRSVRLGARIVIPCSAIDDLLNGENSDHPEATTS